MNIDSHTVEIKQDVVNASSVIVGKGLEAHKLEIKCALQACKNINVNKDWK